MNILAVIQRYHPIIGGSENLAKSHLDYLSVNHNVTVFTTTAKEIQSFWYKDSPRLQQNNNLDNNVKQFDFLVPTDIKYEKEQNSNFPFVNSYPGPFSPQLWNELLLKEINYDLIYVTSFPHDHIIPAYIAAKKWNIPIIITPLMHQEFPEMYLTATKLTMLNSSDAIFVLSESEKKILINQGIDNNKISMIKPALDIISDEKHDKDFSTVKKVVFIGSKSFVKGIIHLIEAMKKVWKNRNDVVLVLIGPDTIEFNEYFKKLPNKIQKKIIDKNITSTKERNNILSSCDMLVLPSKSESFGLVYFEAWLFEKPVIGCNVLPISEIIEDKKNGLLVEFGNVKKLSDAINFLLDNPSICKKYGANGLEKAKPYNSENNLKDFEKKCISIVENFKHKKYS